MNRKTRVFVYETISADPGCTDTALVSQGRAMRDAIVADLTVLDGVEVGCAGGGAPDPPASSRLQAVRQAPGESPENFLHRQTALHDLVWVVAPETGGLLAALRAVVADDQWLGCSADAIAIAGSKRATAKRLCAAGIDATSPLDLRDPPALEGGQRLWIVKPDDGCGATGARRHSEFPSARADYEQRQLRQEDAVLEPWVDGEPLSVSLLCSPGRSRLLTVNRQHIGCAASGLLSFDGITRAPQSGERTQALAALGQRIQEALPGLCGFVGVDVTWHPQRGPVVIEINPRVTCAYEGLSGLLGRNLAQETLALHRRVHRRMYRQTHRLAPASVGRPQAC